MVWYGLVWQGKVKTFLPRNNLNNFELDDKQYPWYRRPPIEKWRELRQYVYARDNGKCRYCGVEVELFQCHIHHVLPLSQGGTNHPGNLKTVCKKCHEIKHPHMADSISFWQ